MSRLTKKLGEGFYVAFVPNTDTLKEKLGKLEDLEEELGCPLEVVFKAIKVGAYFKTDYYGTNITYHILQNNEINFKENVFDIRKENLLDNKPYYSGGFIFHLKDYGKTWWLKEEMKQDE